MQVLRTDTPATATENTGRGGGGVLRTERSLFRLALISVESPRVFIFSEAWKAYRNNFNFGSISEFVSRQGKDNESLFRDGR